jgi:nickel/cobalt transporter (NicO) family protein
MNLTLTMVAAAAAVGAVHTLAPDHWVPFAALARAERWSACRTALVTGACGLGHVTVSAALGLLALLFGLELLQTFGARLESAAGLLLIGFGVAYAVWGVGQRHADTHHHRHHHHAPKRVTAWTLFVVFSADPCVAVIPLIFASAPLGWMSTLAVTAAYELATIATMIAMVLPARVAANAVRGAWADRWGHALAGVIVATIGAVVAVAGI